MNRPCDNDILLVGEGDFSFSIALRVYLPSANIYATSYLTEEELQLHKDALKNISILKQQGVRVFHGIDATDLSAHSEVCGKAFQRVIFNFPHTGGKVNIKKNRQLLKQFFLSVREVLAEGGSVYVTLCGGQGGTPADRPMRTWGNTWQVVAMAAHAGFILTELLPFVASSYPEYSSTGFRSQDKHFNTEGALIHVFQRSSPRPVPAVSSNHQEIQLESQTFKAPSYIANKLQRYCEVMEEESHPLNLTWSRLKTLFKIHSPCPCAVVSPGSRVQVSGDTGASGSSNPCRYQLHLVSDGTDSEHQVPDCDEAAQNVIAADLAQTDHSLSPGHDMGSAILTSASQIYSDNAVNKVAPAQVMKSPAEKSLLLRTSLLDTVSVADLCYKQESKSSEHELNNEPGGRSHGFIQDTEMREFRVLAASFTTDVVEDVAKTRNSQISEGKMMLMIGDVYHSTPVSSRHLPIHCELLGLVHQSHTTVEELVSCLSNCIRALLPSKCQVSVLPRSEADMNHQYCAHITTHSYIQVNFTQHSLDGDCSAKSESTLQESEPECLMNVTESSCVVGVVGHCASDRQVLAFTVLLDALTQIVFDIQDARLLWTTDARYYQQFLSVCEQKNPNTLGSVASSVLEENDLQVQGESYHNHKTCTSAEKDQNDIASCEEAANSYDSGSDVSVDAASCTSGICRNYDQASSQWPPSFAYPFSIFPPLWVHDLSFWESDSVRFDDYKFADIVRNCAGDDVQEVSLIDSYVDPVSGQRSRCYRGIYRSCDHALSYDRSHDIQNVVRLTVAKEMSVTLR